MTPLSYRDLKPQTFAYEFRLKGYQPARARGEVKPGAKSQAGVTMKKILGPEPGQPFENSLGMKFAPVAGLTAFFAVWDVRVQDYEKFVAATRREWVKPSFAQGPTHPAVNVSWDDAQAFCAWLTETERVAGRLEPGQKYRLPTDTEWSVAAGLNEPRGGTPEKRSMQIKEVYPWGGSFPPPRGAGNYGSSLNVDDFANTSPVGSYAASGQGLYDLGGNVWQWCEDDYDGTNKYRVLRGGSFYDNVAGNLLSSYRSNRTTDSRRAYVGFRCVLAVAASP